MTDVEKLTLVRAMVGMPANDEMWSDDILEAYLDIASAKIINKAYPFGTATQVAVPPKYESLQCEVAVYLLNRRGSEGQTSHSENGVSRSYESADVPESMLKAVTPFVGVI